MSHVISNIDNDSYTFCIWYFVCLFCTPSFCLFVCLFFPSINHFPTLLVQGYDIGSDTIRFVMRQVANLSSDWGGYVTIYGGPLNNDTSGSLSVFLNHFGANNSSSNNEINQLLDHNPYGYQYLKFDRNFSTFLQYEVNKCNNHSK